MRPETRRFGGLLELLRCKKNMLLNKTLLGLAQ